jgi:hypothetical protein
MKLPTIYDAILILAHLSIRNHPVLTGRVILLPLKGLRSPTDNTERSSVSLVILSNIFHKFSRLGGFDF